MRILILHFLNKQNSKYTAILKNLEAAVTNNGHQVTVVDAKDLNNLHFAMYEYIAVVTVSEKTIGAKLPQNMLEILSQHGSLSGIKGCSLVVKKGLSSEKMSRLVMHAMEREGMVIDYFQIIESADHAKAIGKKIG
jgi:hypothetical protein